MNEEQAGTTSASPETADETVTTPVPTMREAVRAERAERRNAKKVGDQTEETQEVAEEEVETETEETEAVETEEVETEEETTEEETTDVLSQIDWDAYTDEEKAAIAEQVGSGAGKRIGKLTSEIKQLKEELSQRDDALSEGLSKFIGSDNAFSNVNDMSQLNEAESALETQIDTWENWIAGSDEPIKFKGKDYYSSDEDGRRIALDYVKQLRTQSKQIPKQRDYLRQLESLSDKSEKYVEKASSEFDWFHDDEDEAYKQYQKLSKTSDMKLLERVAPAMAAELKYTLAHAANSITNKPTVKKKLPIKKKVPSNVPGGGGVSRDNGTTSRKISQLQKTANDVALPRAQRQQALKQIRILKRT